MSQERGQDSTVGVMVSSSLLPLMKVRLLVSFLGERAQFGWWPTAFYDASSRLFLEPIFSKTSQLAQYHGALEAGRRLHDEHLNVGTYHLFRLPEELEQDLHNIVQSGADEISPTILFQDKQTALDALTSQAGSCKKDGIGPVAIGNVDEITDKIQAIASIYAAAFASNAQSFPYLTR